MSKTERLKSRKGIEQLFKSGRSFGIAPFRIFYLYEEKGEPAVQAGFGVSAKNVKKAVARNRIKRLMKEAYRTRKNELQELVSARKGHLRLFFIYNARELPSLTLVDEKIQLILQGMVKIIHEIPPSNT